MAAEVITPTVVQKRVLPQTVVYGATERKIVELYMEGAKTEASDWFLVSDYQDLDAEGAQVISFHGIINAAAGASSAEPYTYTQTSTAANAKLVCAGGTATGVVSAFVYYYTV